MSTAQGHFGDVSASPRWAWEIFSSAPPALPPRPTQPSTPTAFEIFAPQPTQPSGPTAFEIFDAAPAAPLPIPPSGYFTGGPASLVVEVEPPARKYAVDILSERPLDVDQVAAEARAAEAGAAEPDFGLIAYELDLGLPPPPATTAAPAPAAVGDTVTSSNPAYERQVARRIAASRPMLRRSTRKMEIRDWDLAFGPASAPAGSSILFSANPQCFFRGEKVVATDTGSPQGSGTRIMQVSIGQRIQRPNGGGAQNGAGSLTQFFASTALGNGLLWDTCQPSLQISVLVSFVQACTFDMTVFGRAAF